MRNCEALSDPHVECRHLRTLEWGGSEWMRGPTVLSEVTNEVMTKQQMKQ